MDRNLESKISTCKIYDVEKLGLLLDGIQAAACMISDVSPVVDEASIVRRVGELTVVGSEGSVCGSCNAGPFSSRQSQTQHYRGAWHTYNLRRKLLGKRIVTQGEYEDRKDGGSSTSSDSDSDSDEAMRKGGGGGEVSELFLAATRHCRAYFTNRQGQMLSVYRCLLHHKKEVIGRDGMGQGWVSACIGLLNSGGWAVLMCSGGHFAGAVFRGPSSIPIKHKTFHAYVTRRGQGKTQMTKDSQGNAPRSAGASLRRYNQEKYIQYVQEVLQQWKDELRACSLVLYRAVGPLNQRALFGPESPLNKEDTRLRTLPFPTRRPSHREVLRAHNILSTVEVYESPEVFQKVFNTTSISTESADKASRSSRQKKTSPIKLDRAKSREMTVRPLPQEGHMSSEDETPRYQQGGVPIGWTHTLAKHVSLPEPSKDFLQSEDAVASRVEQSVGVGETLEEFGDSVKKKAKKKKKQGNNNSNVGSAVDSLRDQIRINLSVKEGEGDGGREKGDSGRGKEKEGKSKPVRSKTVIKVSEKIKKLWQELCGEGATLQRTLDSWEDGSVAEAINTPDPADGNTALHKAAIAEAPHIVTVLLEAGGDPCVKNLQLQTPYTATSHADTRIAFRLFQGAYPDRHNYAKANIPGGLTPELLEQEREKKAAQKKAKRLKDKEKVQEKTKVNKFLQMNDKQKIACGGEQRCFTCGGAYSQPFQYEEYRFCSVRCLQSHRNTRPLKLSTQ